MTRRMATTTLMTIAKTTNMTKKGGGMAWRTTIQTTMMMRARTGSKGKAVAIKWRRTIRFRETGLRFQEHNCIHLAFWLLS